MAHLSIFASGPAECPLGCPPCPSHSHFFLLHLGPASDIFPTTIERLLLMSGPLDVPYRIMAVIIDPIKSEIRRGLCSDVINKFLKRYEAKFYSSATIVTKATILRIGTPHPRIRIRLTL